MIDKNYLPEAFTLSVQDAFVYDNTLFDNFDLGSIERTEAFKRIFLGQWGIYGIGAETIELFKIWITNVFNVHKDYYIEKLNWLDSKVELEGASYKDEIQYIDLPNKTTALEYVTSKEKREFTDTTETLDRKIKYLKTIKNVMLEFVMEFKKCMNLIFY